MAVLRYWLPGLVIVIVVASVPFQIYIRRRVRKNLQAALPDSPLHVLEQRLAAGEISPEEFQYERYLLEKRD